MNEDPKLSGSVTQIEEVPKAPETITLSREEFEQLVQANALLSGQVELMGGLLRLALPMLGGPLIYTQEVLEEEIDKLAINISTAKEVLSAKDAFNFGLQLGIDMNSAFVAICQPRPAADAAARKARRAQAKEDAKPQPKHTPKAQRKLRLLGTDDDTPL